MTSPQNIPLPRLSVPPQPSAPRPALGRSVDLVTDRCTRAVPHARVHVRDVLRTWQVPASLVDDVALLVTELTANAVNHGTGPVLRVHTRCHDHVVRCQVHDDGPRQDAEPPSHAAPASGALPTGASPTGVSPTGASPTGVPPSDAPPTTASRHAGCADPLPEHGRGLELVNALATYWGTYTDPGLTSGRHVAWFEITYPETDTATLQRVLDGLRRM